MGSGWNWYQTGNNACYILKVIKFQIEKYLLTSLKVSSLTCKCEFYRPELNEKGGPMELNFEYIEMIELKE